MPNKKTEIGFAFSNIKGRENTTAPTKNPFIYATISEKIPKVIKLNMPATTTTLKLFKNIKKILPKIPF